LLYITSTLCQAKSLLSFLRGSQPWATWARRPIDEMKGEKQNSNYGVQKAASAMKKKGVKFEHFPEMEQDALRYMERARRRQGGVVQRSGWKYFVIIRAITLARALCRFEQFFAFHQQAINSLVILGHFGAAEVRLCITRAVFA